MTENRRFKGSAGQGAIVLVVIVLIVGAAVTLLTRTLVLARDIDDKSENIAKTGRGISTATDAIIQLDRTNQLGRSILATAQPLQGKLDTVVGHAQSIDGSATSINRTAVAINSTAKAINRTGSAINGQASGISGEAATIQDVAKSIRAGVATINRNVDGTIVLAQQIGGDLGNILVQARTASKLSACIDEGSRGQSDGHCK